jgi:hypothetical protein
MKLPNIKSDYQSGKRGVPQMGAFECLKHHSFLTTRNPLAETAVALSYTNARERIFHLQVIVNTLDRYLKRSKNAPSSAVKKSPFFRSNSTLCQFEKINP